MTIGRWLSASILVLKVGEIPDRRKAHMPDCMQSEGILALHVDPVNNPDISELVYAAQGMPQQKPQPAANATD
ncbi:MAG: hypothetical protein KJ065_12240 [Anaerolineae bacterium]|nr:hypothetical protein [Anaerolineae bacterium]